MKAIFITGNQPRHAFFVSKIHKYFSESVWFVDERNNNLKSSKGVKKKSLNNHLIDLKKSKNKIFFCKIKFTKKLIKKNIIQRSEFFDNSLFNKLKFMSSDYLFTYGCGKLSNKILKIKTIKNYFNLHGGLSPYYKGSITNFWPSYFLSPQFSGMTLHQISENLDGGDIFFQTSSRIRKKDNINDLSMQNSKDFTLLFEKKFKSRKFFKVKKGIKQEKKYGIWKKSHLTKDHISLVYSLCSGKINNFVLKNKILISKPNLIDVYQ